MHALTERLATDIERGYTTRGPHREDMTVYYGDSPLELVASRGETRTTILALKIIELQGWSAVPTTACCPITWPVGQGKSFGGIINLRTQSMTVFTPGSDRDPKDFKVIPLSEGDKLRALWQGFRRCPGIHGTGCWRLGRMGP